MSHYRVKATPDGEGHEFEARHDEEAVHTATAYALARYGPSARFVVHRETFLAWVLVDELTTPCLCGEHTCTTFSEGALR